VSILSRFKITRLSNRRAERAAAGHDPSFGWILAAVAVVVVATLTPQPGRSPGADFFDPLRPGSVNQWRDIAQNVLLYFPLGGLLAIRGRSGLRTVLTAAGLSLATELIQLVVPGRDPSARDVVTNSLGALAGWTAALTGLGDWFQWLLRSIEKGLVAARYPSRPRSAELSFLWALVVSIVIFVTCWLESVALPPPFFFGVANSSIDNPSGPLRIGSDGSGVRGFDGLIDEVRIYTRARSPQEITSDMGRPVAHDSLDPDLVAAFGFDSNGSGASIDAGGLNQSALATDVTWSPDGRYGGALKFNGRTSQVLLSDAKFNLSRGLTLEAWVFPSARLIDDAPVIADGSDTFFFRASSYRSSVPRSGIKFGGAPRMVGPRRSLPRTQWTHMATTYDGRQLRLYVNGQVESVFDHWSTHQPVRATLNGVELPFGLMTNPQQLPAVLLSGFSLKVTVRCGALEEEPAPAFLIAGLQSINVLELLAAGSELRVRYPQQARQLGLAPADLRIPGALTDCAPGTNYSVDLQGPLQASRLYDQRGVELRGVRPGLGSAWSFLLDSQLMPMWIVATVSACFLVALVFPFGFWVRPTLASAAGAAVLLASFALAPRVWDLAPAGSSDVVSAGAGFVMGVLVSVRARRVAASRSRRSATSRV